MDERKVTGVNVENLGERGSERITRLCGEGFNMTVGEVLDHMKQGDTFYVQPDGEPRVDVYAHYPTDGREPFVATSPDETVENNLLHLKSGCPLP